MPDRDGVIGAISHADIRGGLMNPLLVAMVAGASLIAISAGASAQQLPKSGSIGFHTGWKDTADTNEVAPNRFQGQDRAVGTTFNDKGSGPLHLGPANCSGVFVVTDGSGPIKGYCAFGDADGDRIFTDYTGNITPNGAEGTNIISGGTGKYTGITGSGPWKCKGSGKNGELQCAQRFDYKLP
jgi:hypothetical protein